MSYSKVLNSPPPEVQTTQQDTSYKRNSLEDTQTHGPEKKKSKTVNLQPVIPTIIYHIPWTPPTPEARTAFLMLHHKQTTIAHVKHILVSPTLSESDILHLSTRPCQQCHYTSRRVIYVSTTQEQSSSEVPSQKWHRLFTSQLSNLEPVPKPQTSQERKCINRINTEKNTLVSSIQDQSLEEAFLKLEAGSIDLESYSRLRSKYLNIKDKRLNSAQCIFFPSIRGCNVITQSRLKKFTHPIFLLAAKAFLSIAPRALHTEKVLTKDQQCTIKRFQDGDFVSIIDLEKAASLISPSLHHSTLKSLVDNAIAIMEENHFLPITGPINNIIQFTHAEQTPTITNTIEPKQAQQAQAAIIQPEKPIRTTLIQSKPTPKFPLIDCFLQTQRQQSNISHELQEKNISTTTSLNTTIMPEPCQTVPTDKYIKSTKLIALTEPLSFASPLKLTQKERIYFQGREPDCTMPRINYNVIDSTQENEYIPPTMSRSYPQYISCSTTPQENTIYIKPSISTEEAIEQHTHPQQAITPDTNFTSEEILEQSTSSWTDYAYQRVTRSMTAPVISNTKEPKPASTDSKLCSARTRPILKKQAKTSKITRAISISLIGRYTLKQVRETQQTNTKSNEQAIFMNALGLIHRQQQ